MYQSRSVLPSAGTRPRIFGGQQKMDDSGTPASTPALQQQQQQQQEQHQQQTVSVSPVSESQLVGAAGVGGFAELDERCALFLGSAAGLTTARNGSLMGKVAGLALRTVLPQIQEAFQFRIYVCDSFVGELGAQGETFDPIARTWTAMAPAMPALDPAGAAVLEAEVDGVPRWGGSPGTTCAAASMNGLVYIFGGRAPVLDVPARRVEEAGLEVEAGRGGAADDPLARNLGALRRRLWALRRAAGPVEIVVGEEGGGQAGDIEQKTVARVFDPGLNGGWTRLAPIPAPARTCFAVASANRRLYIFGGQQLMDAGVGDIDDGAQQPQELRSCVVFNPVGGNQTGTASAGSEARPGEPSVGSWRELPPMRVGRARCCACAARGRVYVVGGVQNGEVVGATEVFDPVTETWENLPPMPTPRAGCAAATVGGMVYVFGGWGSNEEDLSTGEVYDPATRTWAELPPMPTPRVNSAAVAYGGRIYVLGGECLNEDDTSLVGSRSAEVFDPRAWARLEASGDHGAREPGPSSPWSVLPPMRLARCQAAAACTPTLPLRPLLENNPRDGKESLDSLPGREEDSQAQKRRRRE